MTRSPFLAWLVTGPAGRLVGFTLDFGRALWTLWKPKLAAKLRR